MGRVFEGFERISGSRKLPKIVIGWAELDWAGLLGQPRRRGAEGTGPGEGLRVLPGPPRNIETMKLTPENCDKIPET